MYIYLYVTDISISQDKDTDPLNQNAHVAGVINSNFKWNKNH